MLRVINKGDRVILSPKHGGSRNKYRIGIVQDYIVSPSGWLWVHVLWHGQNEAMRYLGESLQFAPDDMVSIVDPIPERPFNVGDRVKRTNCHKRIASRIGSVVRCTWYERFEHWIINVKWDGRVSYDYINSSGLIKVIDPPIVNNEITSSGTVYIKAKQMVENGLIKREDYICFLQAEECLINTISIVLTELNKVK